MLSKLIRYEWKAVARVCIPMYGGLILGIAVLGAGFFVLTRYLLKNHLNLE